MMNQWCIVKKSRVTEELKDSFEPRELTSGQVLVRVTEKNSFLLNNYKKYDLEDLRETDLERKTLHAEKGEGNSPFKDKQVCNGHKLFKRLHGSGFVDIAPNSSAIIEIEIGYAWAKIEAMEIIGAGKKHSCNLLVVDTENGNYSGVPDAELNQFCYDAAIAENFHRFASKYDADLYLGMGVQIEVTNNSTTVSSVALNLELNEVVK